MTSSISKNILMLQGPVGSFFQRVSDDLRLHGHRVYKVNFNAGDRLFYRRPGALAFCGTPREWPDWLEHFLITQKISRIYLFGDSRYYHRIARKVAKKLGIEVYAFECGYIRPDFVTLETGGVNGNSEIPSDPEFYRSFDATPSRRSHVLKFDFFKAGLWVCVYYLAITFGQWRYPHYRHHRSTNPLTESGRWVFAGLQKTSSFLRQPFLKRTLYKDDSDYFLVPLQVHNDSQVRRHSHYRNIEQFIIEVVDSFAQSAPANTRLVLKHHPMDRPYRHYSRLVQDLSAKHKLGDRLVYLHDLHLPTLLERASGVVTINSTVGLSSVHHRTPVIALGKAIYNIDGLSYQMGLDNFWQAPGKVDSELYIHFRAYLLRNNQLRGSLYQPLANSTDPSGLEWPVHLRKIHLNGKAEVPHLKLVPQADKVLQSAA